MQPNGSNPVLSLFRLIAILFALPFLTATATSDLSTASTSSLHATPSASVAKLVKAPVRVNFPVAKRITAELEDGPEGEDDPVANLVRGFDGDDQIGTQFSFVTIAFHVVAWSPHLETSPPAPSHAPCAGLPTGPPFA